MEEVKLIIENCESILSEWLKLEYKHCIELWQNIALTNVQDEKMRSFLSKYSEVHEEDVSAFIRNKQCIVLDPAAEKELQPEDFKNIEVIVIGGILGYEKPRYRTKKLITDKLNAEAKNLGKIQLSIDSAVFVAKAIDLGMKLKEIQITTEVEIVYDDMHSTILPFGYPILDGKLIITPGLVEYLKEVE